MLSCYSRPETPAAVACPSPSHCSAGAAVSQVGLSPCFFAVDRGLSQPLRVTCAPHQVPFLHSESQGKALLPSHLSDSLARGAHL